MNINVLRNLSYGMYAIGVKGERGPSACIVNTVVQVTSTDPLVIALSMNHDNYSHRCITETGLFTVSVLSEDTPGPVIGALGFTSGSNVDKLTNIRHKVLQEGVPVITENTCCWILCRLRSSIDTPTHTVFLAEIIAGSEKSVGTPMTYAYYHTVIKGSAPKNAPTYQPPEKEQDKDVERYICTVCTYVYSSSEVPFADLPDDWVCPICGVQKALFQRA